MSDNPNVVNQDSLNPNEQKQESINPNDVKQESESASHNVPYGKFKEQRDKTSSLEKQIAQMRAANQKAEQMQLEKDGKIAEALELQKKENERLQPYENKWNTYEEAERERLIQKFPEEMKENVSQHSLTVLQDMAKLLDVNKPSAPAVNVTNAPATRVHSNNNLQSEFNNMSDEKKKASWLDYLNTFDK